MDTTPLSSDCQATSHDCRACGQQPARFLDLAKNSQESLFAGELEEPPALCNGCVSYLYANPDAKSAALASKELKILPREPGPTAQFVARDTAYLDLVRDHLSPQQDRVYEAVIRLHVGRNYASTPEEIAKYSGIKGRAMNVRSTVLRHLTFLVGVGLLRRVDYGGDLVEYLVRRPLPRTTENWLGVETCEDVYQVAASRIQFAKLLSHDPKRNIFHLIFGGSAAVAGTAPGQSELRLERTPESPKVALQSDPGIGEPDPGIGEPDPGIGQTAVNPAKSKPSYALSRSLDPRSLDPRVPRQKIVPSIPPRFERPAKHGDSTRREDIGALSLAAIRIEHPSGKVWALEANWEELEQFAREIRDWYAHPLGGEKKHDYSDDKIFACLANLTDQLLELGLSATRLDLQRYLEHGRAKKGREAVKYPLELLVRNDSGRSRIRDWWIGGELKRVHAQRRAAEQRTEAFEAEQTRFRDEQAASVAAQGGELPEFLRNVPGIEDVQRKLSSTPSPPPVSRHLRQVDLDQRDKAIELAGRRRAADRSARAERLMEQATWPTAPQTQRPPSAEDLELESAPVQQVPSAEALPA